MGRSSGSSSSSPTQARRAAHPLVPPVNQRLCWAAVQFALAKPNERILAVHRNAAGGFDFTSFTPGVQA